MTAITSVLVRKTLLREKGADSTPEAVATSTVTTVKALQGDKHVGYTEGPSNVADFGAEFTTLRQGGKIAWGDYLAER